MKYFKRPEWRHPRWLLALLFAASALLPAAHAAVQPLDHIVAIVNDEVITRQELARRYQEVVRNLSRQNTPLPPRDVLEKQLLERMITELALQQHARSTGADGPKNPALHDRPHCADLPLPAGSRPAGRGRVRTSFR